MEDYLKQNSIFCIVPDNVEDSTYIEFDNLDSSVLTFKNPEFKINVEENEYADFFSNGSKGILYFKTKLISYNNEVLKTEFPEEFQILQRRESQRIPIKEKIEIIRDNFSTTAELIDLSVGGMKIKTEYELKINENYKACFNFDNINLEFTFSPTRIAFEDEEYIVSGQIYSKNSTDKIELIQYCYKKQFEQSNRN